MFMLCAYKVVCRLVITMICVLQQWLPLTEETLFSKTELK